MSIYKMRTEFGHHFKWIMAFIALIFVVGAVYQFGSAPVMGPGSGNKREVLATVGDVELKSQDFEASWAPIADSPRDYGADSTMQLANKRAELFMQLLEGRRVYAAAQKMGVDVSQDAVDKLFDQRVEERLRENRRALMGKMTAEEERTPPSDDDKYKAELESIGRSVSQMEDQLRSTTPRSGLEEIVVHRGIREKLDRAIAPVTGKTVADSFDTYKVSQIVVSTAKLPDAQARNKAKKIAAEAKAGKDFAALAKQNSDDTTTKDRGGATQLSMDALIQPMEYSAQQIAFRQINMSGGQQPDMKTMMAMYNAVREDPVAVGQGLQGYLPMILTSSVLLEEAAKMKPGAIAGPIKTPVGYYIVKLDSVNKPAAKTDKKALKERKKQIERSRIVVEWLKTDAAMRKGAQIVVEDPEMAGYYNQYLAQQAAMMGNQSAYKRYLAVAAKRFAQARKEMPNFAPPGIKYAQVLEAQGKTRQATVELARLLDGSAQVYGGDIRLWLGEMLLRLGDAKSKGQALKQFARASDTAKDRQVHDRLLALYKQMNEPRLASQESAWLADYDAKSKAWQERQQAEQQKSRSSAKPEPTKPRNGG